MTDIFQVKSKTAIIQAMKLGMFKHWKSPDPIGYVKFSVDPLTLSKDNNFLSKYRLGQTPLPSALILPVVKFSSKLDCI